MFFGATVTYADAHDARTHRHILGVDEADITRGEVSLDSPVARALLRARVGDSVRLHTPAGVEAVEVLAITYPDG